MDDEVQIEKSYVTCVRSHNQVTELNNEEWGIQEFHLLCSCRLLLELSDPKNICSDTSESKNSSSNLQ